MDISQRPPNARPDAVAWQGGRVRLLDQRRLPAATIFVETDDPAVLAEAIRSMQVRGAPAIGIAAAYGLAAAALHTDGSLDDIRRAVTAAAALLRGARPTAVNLGWAIDRTLRAAGGAASREALRTALLAEARAIHAEDVAANRRLGALGAPLLPTEGGVLTHCNAGALATGGYGTALGILRAAREHGARREIYVCETRPLLQGARLTAWELLADGFSVTLLPDSAAGALLASGAVGVVVVGADRIAANGDVANKIGTYPLAVLAQRHDLPFIVAAPWSSVDLATPSGADIPIEQRDPAEVTQLGGRRTAPDGVQVLNPAFDVTPHDLIHHIVTERGVHTAPFGASLAAATSEHAHA